MNEVKEVTRVKAKRYGVSFLSYTLRYILNIAQGCTRFFNSLCCVTFHGRLMLNHLFTPVSFKVQVIQRSHFVQEPRSTTLLHSLSPKNYFWDLVSVGGVYFLSLPHPRTVCLVILASWVQSQMIQCMVHSFIFRKHFTSWSGWRGIRSLSWDYSLDGTPVCYMAPCNRSHATFTNIYMRFRVTNALTTNTPLTGIQRNRKHMCRH